MTHALYPISVLNNPPAPTYPEYPGLRDEAVQTVPRFVDPADPYVGRAVAGRRGPDWCTAVLGFPFPGHTRLTGVQGQLLVLADQADVDPPLPKWVVEGRAAGERVHAELESWRATRAAAEADRWRDVLAATTVRLEVRESGTARARHGLVEALRHAAPLEDVQSGVRAVRVHRAGRALCESPTRARPLNLGGVTDQPATCVRCLEWAPKISSLGRAER